MPFKCLYFIPNFLQKAKSTSDVGDKAGRNKIVEVVNADSALIISSGITQQTMVPSLDKVPTYGIDF